MSYTCPIFINTTRTMLDHHPFPYRLMEYELGRVRRSDFMMTKTEKFHSDPSHFSEVGVIN